MPNLFLWDAENEQQQKDDEALLLFKEMAKQRMWNNNRWLMRLLRLYCCLMRWQSREYGTTTDG